MLAVVALAGAARAQAATRTCETGDSTAYYLPNSNGYITALVVTKVSCKAGRSLGFAYYRCRHRNGGRKGRCTRKVQGYSCKEKRGVIGTTNFDGTVTCRRGSRKVVHSYTQNL